MKPKIFIGPMSKNIVDSIITYANKNNTEIGLIPSRRQVENTGGYVNNWTTKDFCDYVKQKSKNILLVRDHCGPSQGHHDDDGVESFLEDCKHFDIIHVDVWKKHKDYNDGLNATVRFITLGYKTNPSIMFEIGTEEAIRATDSIELDRLITDLKSQLPKEIYGQIKYAVIQSGTALKGNTNVGSFNQERLISMVEVVKKHGLISKEHNGDYLSNDLVKSKFSNGLECINIAPEFGQIETKIVLNKIKETRPDLFEEFYKICLDSKRWVKWVDSNFIPENNKEEIINISGHYVFSEPRFIEMKSKIQDENLDNEIQTAIYARVEELLNAINEK